MRRILKVMLFSCLMMVMITSCFLNREEVTVNRYALIYTVDYDNDPSNQLNNTVHDGDDMEIVFQALGFTGDHEQNYTNAQILAAIEAHEDVATADDITLFYFSGHGYVQDGVSELYPYKDGISYDPITVPELFEALDAVPGEKVIILDICNSGGFVPSDGYDVDGLPEAYGEDLDYSIFIESWSRFFSQEDIANEYPTIHVISAAGQDEDSYESGSIENGFYTYFLLKSLGYDHDTETVDEDAISADANSDGYVSLSELYEETFDLFSESPYMIYYSHISGGPYDPVLVDYLPD